MFYDHKKKEILDFIKECYQLTFDTTKILIVFRQPPVMQESREIDGKCQLTFYYFSEIVKK